MRAHAAWCLAALGFLLVVCAPTGLALGRGRPLYGGRLVVPLSAPLGSVDPAQAREFNEILAAMAVHAPLFRFDAAGRLVPHLLADWPAAERGALRCTLRSGLTFHDGRPLTAHDVRYSIQRQANLSGDVPLRFLPALMTVEALDELTFRLRLVPRLSADTAYRLLALAQAAIVPRGGNVTIGAGPFRSAGPPSGPLVFEASLGDARGRPYLDAVLLPVLRDEAAVAEAFHYGRAHVCLGPCELDREQPTLLGPERETLFIGFTERWRGPAYRAARAGVRRRVVPADMMRHFDERAVAARAITPPELGPPPPAGAPEAAAPWHPEPLTVGYPAGSRALVEVAQAVRDLLQGETLAQAAPIEGPLPGSTGRLGGAPVELFVASLAWPTPEAATALFWLRSRLEPGWRPAERELTAALKAPRDAWRDYARDDPLVALLHFRRTIRLRSAVRGLRFDAAGQLVFDDVWLATHAGGRP